MGIRSTSTTESSTSVTTTTCHRIIDIRAITATGMGIEATESARALATALDRASGIDPVRIWATVGDLAMALVMETDTATETVTDMVAGTHDTAVTDTVHWAGGWEAGALAH